MAPDIRPIQGHPGYHVSSDGRVFSEFGPGVHRRREGRRYELRPGIAKAGNKTVALRGVSQNVHHLVAITFLGPVPDRQEVRHLNGDPLDNRIANLAYGTRSQNVADMHRHGRALIGARHPFAKLNAARVRRMRSDRSRGLLYREIAAANHVSFATAYNAITRKTWRGVP